MPRGSESALRNSPLRAPRADRETCRVRRAQAWLAGIPSRRAAVRRIAEPRSGRRHRCAFRSDPCRAVAALRWARGPVSQGDFRANCADCPKCPTWAKFALCRNCPTCPSGADPAASTGHETSGTAAAARPWPWRPPACHARAPLRAPHHRRPRHPAATGQLSRRGSCVTMNPRLAAAVPDHEYRMSAGRATPNRGHAAHWPWVSRRPIPWRDFSDARCCGALRRQRAWVCLAAGVLGSWRDGIAPDSEAASFNSGVFPKRGSDSRSGQARKPFEHRHQEPVRALRFPRTPPVRGSESPV